MKMTVVNKKIKIEEMKIEGIGGSSFVLIGDTESITASHYFDTPSDSLIFSPQVPLKPVKKQ